MNNTFGVELAGRTWRLATGTLHLLGDWRKVSGSACVRAVVISHAKVQAQRIVEQLRAARSLDRPPPCHTLNQSSTHLFGHPAGGRYPFSWTSAFPRLDFLFAFEWGRLRQMGECIACRLLFFVSWQGSRSASLPAANCAKLRWRLRALGAE